MQTDNWYVLHVLTGKEQDVLAAALQLDGVEAFVPTEIILERTTAEAPFFDEELNSRAERALNIKFTRGAAEWIEVPRILFPGYVFVRVARMDAQRYYQFKRIMSVIRILGFADGDIPRPVPQEEMEIFCGMGAEPVGVSIGERVNGKVKITSGPLLALQDYIKKLDTRQCRATVEIPLLGRPYTLKLALKIETPSSQDAPEAE